MRKQKIAYGLSVVLALMPLSAYANDGSYSVSYYDSEADYFNGSSSSAYSSGSSDIGYNNNSYIENTDHETIYTDTRNTTLNDSGGLWDYIPDNSTLGTDTVYGAGSTPTNRLWSEVPLNNGYEANLYRGGNNLKPITIKINGEKYVPRDVQPIIIDGRVFVPVRFVVENLGYTVHWDGERMVAEINDGAIEIEVGSYTMKKYDGLTISTDVPPFLYNGTLMIGLRQIGVALNYNVSWDDENRIASLDRREPNYDLKQHNVFDRTVYDE